MFHLLHSFLQGAIRSRRVAGIMLSFQSMNECSCSWKFASKLYAYFKVVWNLIRITGTFKDKVRSCLKAGCLMKKCRLSVVSYFGFLRPTFSWFACGVYKGLGWFMALYISYTYTAQHVLIIRLTSYNYIIDTFYNIQLSGSMGFSILNINLLSNCSTINICTSWQRVLDLARGLW